MIITTVLACIIPFLLLLAAVKVYSVCSCWFSSVRWMTTLSGYVRAQIRKQMFVVVVVDIVTMTVCTALKIDEALNKTACDGTLSICHYLLLSVKLAWGVYT